jgi:acyl carrier protein
MSKNQRGLIKLKLIQLLKPFQENLYQINFLEIDEETNLKDDIGLDSMILLEYFVLIQREFKIKLDIKKTINQKFTCIKDIVDFIAEFDTIDK